MLVSCLHLAGMSKHEEMQWNRNLHKHPHVTLVGKRVNDKASEDVWE